VTPIEEMLAIPTEAETAPPAEATAARLDLAYRPEEPGRFFSELVPRSRLHGDGGGLRPLALPLHAAGFPPEVVAGLGSALGARLVPTIGTTPGKATDPAPPPPVPGSAIGIQLMRGDLDLTAIGTVTSVDGDRVLAFGHPFLNIGPTALPMTAARVHLVVPSVHSSFKVASPTGTIGTALQDRSSGVMGRLGPAPRMVPVRVELAAPDAAHRSFHFDLVDDPLLTPVLLNYAVLSILSSAEKSLGSMSLRLREGSSIQLRDHAPVELDNFYSGDFAAPFASGLSSYILFLLMNNEFLAPRVEGVNLLVDYLDERRSARIDEVWANRDRVRAGDTVTLHVTVRPFRGEPVQKEIELTLPRETPEGRLLVRVGDGLTFARLETEGEPTGTPPRDFDQLVWLINQIRSFDRIYANVSIVDEGLMVGGANLSNLPPSKAQVLLMPQAGGNFVRVRQRGLLEESIETGFGVTGYRKLFLEVVT